MIKGEILKEIQGILCCSLVIEALGCYLVVDRSDSSGCFMFMMHQQTFVNVDYYVITLIQAALVLTNNLNVIALNLA